MPLHHFFRLFVRTSQLVTGSLPIIDTQQSDPSANRAGSVERTRLDEF